MSDSHITRYDRMPIPPVEAHTEYFEAGAIRFGVEYRLLTDAIAAANRDTLEAASGRDSAGSDLEDRGVSIHVFGRDAAGERHELLRFDCFDEDPHYHYVSWKDQRNEMHHIDPVADGDPLTWALDRIRTRLAPMLARAGALDAAASVDPRLVESVLPRVSEAAWRLRYHHDDDAILQGALRPSRS